MTAAVSPLVRIDEVKRVIGDNDIALVEATWYPPWIERERGAIEDYRAARIPGAVFFDIDAVADRSTDLPHMLPPEAQFADWAGANGIGADTRIIVYDRNGFIASARAWWSFRAMGFGQVRVLDGGFGAWRDSGGAIQSGPSDPPEPVKSTARLRAALLARKQEVQAAAATGEAAILDARAAARFTGEAPEPRDGLARGHVPRSRNLPSDAVHESGRMKPPEALRGLFSDAGITGQRPLITTCGSGVTAAILALAYAHAGLGEASVYDGSWSEWGADANCPVEVGPAPGKGVER